jgi:hypothetical protein
MMMVTCSLICLEFVWLIIVYYRYMYVLDLEPLSLCDGVHVEMVSSGE